MLPFRLTKTSEKTVEINTCGDLTSLIERRSRRRVTIISPTQQDERHLGFDEMIEGLPAGQVVALQFKRPYTMMRPPDCVRFVISTRQLRSLLNIFLPQQAYYVFVPYPLNVDLVRNRRNLLRDTITVDVHNIPRGRKVGQKTRTVRCYPPVVTLRGRFHRMLRIADPRKFETIKKVDSLENLAEKLIERKIGLQVPRPRKRKESTPSQVVLSSLSI